MVGYRWYVNYVDYYYEPCERTFSSLEDCFESISSYEYYSNEVVGIDLVETDEYGEVKKIIENIQIPIKTYFIDDNEDLE